MSRNLEPFKFVLNNKTGTIKIEAVKVEDFGQNQHTENSMLIAKVPSAAAARQVEENKCRKQMEKDLKKNKMNFETAKPQIQTICCAGQGCNNFIYKLIGGKNTFYCCQPCLNNKFPQNPGNQVTQLQEENAKLKAELAQAKIALEIHEHQNGAVDEPIIEFNIRPRAPKQLDVHILSSSDSASPE